ncbi:MAG TPA: cohesin domain-containing protein [Vicinamibacteria bacterium]|nr:cohesin domain-containing protein [Vicinamibacteria bacterium]
MSLDRRCATFAVALALLLSAGCAASNAYRKGKSEAKKGNWDLAVARFTKALADDPDNISYKIALENARIQASRQHVDDARKHEQAQDLDRAAEELQIAANYDPSNKAANEELLMVREKIRVRDEERAKRSGYEATKARAAAARVPLPVLSPRSQAPISLKFADQSLQKILESLGKLAGVNVVFDTDYRDKRASVDLTGVTFEEALNQITFANRLFYKVLDQNTVVVAAEQAAKRKTYDENLVRTFYLQYAEVNETLQLIKSLAGLQKSAGNVPLGAITVMGTPDELAVAERIIELNDKPRGEVMVEVNIFEVNRNKLKEYGIKLSNYTAGVTFSPTGAEDETALGLTRVRAHMLSSLNLADFVVNIPSSLLARFFQSEGSVKIVASPRLRAAEGKKTSLKVGEEVPIPITTFTAAAQGGTGTFLPATSFQYRNVGVNLELTPKVNVSGDVFLELQAEFSQIGDRVNVGSADNPLLVPTFFTRNVTGVLRLHEGETSLIGGLLQSRETKDVEGAIGLASVPILNKLFSGHVDQSRETEVIISLTPHLLRAPRVSEADLQALYIGTKEITRVPSVRPSLFGEGETPAEPEPSSQPQPSPAPESSPPPQPEAPRAPRAPAAGQARLVWSPAEARLRAGETATLSVVLVGARNVGGIEMQLAYDAAIAEIVAADPGTLLTLDGAAIGSERQLDPGRATFRFTRPQPATGSGAVALLRVKGLRAGTAQIAVESVSVVGAADPPAPPAPAQVVVEP